MMKEAYGRRGGSGVACCTTRYRVEQVQVRASSDMWNASEMRVAGLHDGVIQAGI